MLDSGRAGPEQACATFGYGAHIPKSFLGTANSSLSLGPLAQCDRDCSRLGVSGETCELAGKLTGFVVLDVESHGGYPGRLFSICLPYALTGFNASGTSRELFPIGRACANSLIDEPFHARAGSAPTIVTSDCSTG